MDSAAVVLCHFKVDVVARDAAPQHTSTTKKQEDKYFHNFSVAIMLRDMQRELTRDTCLKASFTLTFPPIISASHSK